LISDNPQPLAKDAMEAPSSNAKIGLVVACHCAVAQEMVRAVELILGPQEGVRAVSMNPDTPLEVMVRELTEAVAQVDRGRGVIVATDLFGGTPTNVALALAGRNVEVVSGVNLPMLIKFAECRASMTLAEAARAMKDYGRHHISVAGEIMTAGSGDRSHEGSSSHPD
jgi:PTS system mannose-specific IIA component